MKTEICCFFKLENYTWGRNPAAGLWLGRRSASALGLKCWTFQSCNYHSCHSQVTPVSADEALTQRQCYWSSLESTVGWDKAFWFSQRKEEFCCFEAILRRFTWPKIINYTIHKLEDPSSALSQAGSNRCFQIIGEPNSSGMNWKWPSKLHPNWSHFAVCRGGFRLINSGLHTPASRPWWETHNIE